jgi:hypothetical protein
MARGINGRFNMKGPIFTREVTEAEIASIRDVYQGHQGVGVYPVAQRKDPVELAMSHLANEFGLSLQNAYKFFDPLLVTERGDVYVEITGRETRAHLEEQIGKKKMDEVILSRLSVEKAIRISDKIGNAYVVDRVPEPQPIIGYNSWRKWLR